MALKRVHWTIIDALLVAAMALLFCSRDYNPFADLTNAKAHVVSWSFADSATVPIYKTGTLTLVVALGDAVDSVRVSATKNRFFSDTAIKGVPVKGGPYNFSVSFFDTGLQKITIKTFRANGDTIPQEFGVRVTSPLRQNAVSGAFGDSFHLSTPPVQDNNVKYHWEFNKDFKVYSLNASESTITTYFGAGDSSSGTGYLWVSGLKDENPSPGVSFRFSFTDHTPPVITCLNSQMHGDTIVTADSLLVFRVYVADKGSGQVELCTVNGQGWDFTSPAKHQYTKLIDSMPKYTRASCKRLEVRAVDNPEFHNTDTAVFWACFDTAGATEAKARIYIVSPQTDLSLSLSPDLHVHGTVDNYSHAPLTLHIKVNDSLYAKSLGIDTIRSDWDWPVHLNKAVNAITVSAWNANVELASQGISVFYDSTGDDKTKPMIWEVSDTCGNVFTGAHDSVYQTGNAISLSVTAFDDGSGIKTVLLNNDTLSPSPNGYTWTGRTGSLKHQRQGNSETVKVIDRANNQDTMVLTVFVNTPPQLTGDPGIPSGLCIDSVYQFKLQYKDDDLDLVQIKWLHTPDSMKTTADGAMAWRPGVRDTAPDSVAVALYDGYQWGDTSVWRFRGVDCSKPITPVRFVTRAQDFPSVLQADRDTLAVKLSVENISVPYIIRYSARFLDRPDTILGNDTTSRVRWAPAIKDTGDRRLMVTVGNGVRTFDTLYPVFWVVPKNQYPCSLSVSFTGATTPQGELDLFSHPAPETLYFAIKDNDNLLTEKYTVTVVQNSVKSVETINKKDFMVVLVPDSMRVLDTVRVSISDMTGTRDSARFVVRYVPVGTNVVARLAGDPTFPPYACADSSYQFTIATYDPDNDLVTVVPGHVPGHMTVSPRGLVLWKPALADTGQDSLVVRLYDGHDYSAAYSWALTVIDCARKPPAVKFKTTVNDFPKTLQAGSDSLAVTLSAAAGTGAAPFAYGARFLDKGTVVLANDAAGRLVWRPSTADTGARLLMVTVQDRYFTGDTIYPTFTVTAQNQFPCSLSYAYSGTVVSPGQIAVFTHAQPESTSFVIHDKDNPATEHYSVTIFKDRALTTRELSGNQRAFSIPFSSTTFMGTDTVVVTVHDATKTADTVRIVVRYVPSAPSEVPQLSLYLNGGAGVSAAGGSVSAWADQDRNQTLAQSFAARQPALVSNAANGLSAVHFTRDFGMGANSDCLYDLNYINWESNAFTIFVVFNLDSVDNTRQTLVSGGGSQTLDLGITCDGHIGIFNENTGNTCMGMGGTVSSNLAVNAHTWYVATFQSPAGINGYGGYFGNVQVNAWLNGAAAAGPLTMNNTQANNNPVIMLGAGRYNYYTGTLDGSIAAVIVYTRALNATERQGIERLLGTWYGKAVP